MRLLHGQADPDVPWEMALRIAEQVTSRDVQVILVKDGDHRLSRPQDLALLRRTLAASPRPGWHVAPRDRSDTASAGRAPAASAGCDTLRFSAQKLRAIGLIAATACSNGTGSGAAMPEQPRRLGHHVGAFRRFVVRQVEHAHAAVARSCRIAAITARTMSSRWMRPKVWPGLTDAPRRPGAQIVERRAAGPVDAGEAEQIDRAAIGEAAASPASAASRRRLRSDIGRGLGVLIDPAAAAVTVDAGGGQIADPAQLPAPRRWHRRSAPAPGRPTSSGGTVDSRCVDCAIDAAASSKGIPAPAERTVPVTAKPAPMAACMTAVPV